MEMTVLELDLDLETMSDGGLRFDREVVDPRIGDLIRIRVWVGRWI